MLVFVVALSVGDVMDRSHRSDLHPTYATLLLPLYASFVCTPMLIAGNLLALHSLPDRSSRVLAIVTSSLALLSLIPSVLLLSVALSVVFR